MRTFEMNKKLVDAALGTEESKNQMAYALVTVAMAMAISTQKTVSKIEVVPAKEELEHSDEKEPVSQNVDYEFVKRRHAVRLDNSIRSLRNPVIYLALGTSAVTASVTLSAVLTTPVVTAAIIVVGSLVILGLLLNLENAAERANER